MKSMIWTNEKFPLMVAWLSSVSISCFKVQSSIGHLVCFFNSGNSIVSGVNPWCRYWPMINCGNAFVHTRLIEVYNRAENVARAKYKNNLKHFGDFIKYLKQWARFSKWILDICPPIVQNQNVKCLCDGNWKKRVMQKNKSNNQTVNERNRHNTKMRSEAISRSLFCLTVVFWLRSPDSFRTIFKHEDERLLTKV